VNLRPHGEPQLGRRGLYGSVGRAPVPEQATYALFWVLNLSDGDHDLVDIALRSGMDLHVVAHAAAELQAVGLLEEV
jgi:aminopeptidase-like protein